jgi:hypothetical protein
MAPSSDPTRAIAGIPPATWEASFKPGTGSPAILIFDLLIACDGVETEVPNSLLGRLGNLKSLVCSSLADSWPRVETCVGWKSRATLQLAFWPLGALVHIR